MTDYQALVEAAAKDRRKLNIVWSAMLVVLVLMVALVAWMWISEQSRASYWRALFLEQCVEDTGCDVQDEIDEGPEGPTGDVGPQGEQGDQGPVGPQGPRGPQGVPGEDGTNGESGADGQNGADGEAGADGQNGAQGEPGPVGPQGETGPQGPQGLTGPQGQSGQDGADAPTVTTVTCTDGVLIFGFSDGSTVTSDAACTPAPPIDPPGQETP